MLFRSSLPFLPLFLPYLSVPMLEAAGDECRRSFGRERHPIFGPFSLDFPTPAIGIDRRPYSSMIGGVAPIGRWPPPRRPWPERPDKRGNAGPLFRRGKNQEEEEEKEKKRKRKEKKKKKRKKNKNIYIYIYMNKEKNK